MSTARHHHYIPQFYLAGFTSSGAKDGQLSVLDLEQRKKWISSVRNAGAERDFNRVDIEGLEIDAVEKALSPFEEEVATVLKKLRKSKELPEPSELFLILEFAALLAVRNKLIRNTLGDAQEKILWLVLQQMLANPDKWKEQREKLEQQGFPVIPELSLEEAEDIVEEGEFEYSPSTTQHVLRELNSVGEVAEMLSHREWTLFYISQGETRFICSDRPISCQWDADMPPGMRTPGFMEEDSEVTMPLSKKLALYGRFDGEERTVEATPRIVGEINTRTASAAKRFIYSPEDDFVCRGIDGHLDWAADILLDPPDPELDDIGKYVVIFTDRGKYHLPLNSYVRDNSNPIKPTVRLWTDDLERLHKISDCGEVEVIYFFEDGEEKGGTRNLKFESVSLSPSEPSVLKADW